MSTPSNGKILRVGLLVGLLLNFSGWLGNNFLLGSMWARLEVSDAGAEWRALIWRDVFSFVPDFVYGVAIAWLCAALRPASAGWIGASLKSGIFVAIIGGIVTYFAVANSGFITWPLAFASFVLVVATKLPLALLAGRMLEPR
jgi:hypothetical protein